MLATILWSYFIHPILMPFWPLNAAKGSRGNSDNKNSTPFYLNMMSDSKSMLASCPPPPLFSANVTEYDGFCFLMEFLLVVASFIFSIAGASKNNRIRQSGMTQK